MSSAGSQRGRMSSCGATNANRTGRRTARRLPAASRDDEPTPPMSKVAAALERTPGDTARESALRALAVTRAAARRGRR